MTDLPYGEFNFIISFDDFGASGGFSKVTGITTERTLTEYRNDLDQKNDINKIPGIRKLTEVSLKGGLISENLFTWIYTSTTQGHAVKKNMVITLFDEARNPVQSWRLREVFPIKYTGPQFDTKSNGEAAIEELVLSIKGILIKTGK